MGIYPPQPLLFHNKQVPVIKMEFFLNCFQAKFSLDNIREIPNKFPGTKQKIFFYLFKVYKAI